MVACGIPVMGHIGLTPQSIHQLGGIRMQGKTPEAAARLVDDAIALEAAGAFALVLETIPDDLAREITTRLSIPTIGIGAGPYCDGQVQVFHDMIGLTVDRVPAHARTYANLGETIRDAAKRYVADVEARPEVFGRPIPAVGTEHEQVALESTIEQPVGMLEQ
jgi:3-methyl-2-oxobutanoate hydroxymethyltransferase